MRFGLVVVVQLMFKERGVGNYGGGVISLRGPTSCGPNSYLEELGVAKVASLLVSGRTISMTAKSTGAGKMSRMDNW